MLERQGLARWSEREDAEVPANLGFLMMSLLADACAGSQVEKVTDRPEAYAWLEEVRAQEVGSNVIKNLTPDQVATAYDRLISVSFRALGAEQVPLENLIELRKREQKERGNDLALLRKRYHKVLREFLVRIGEEAKTAADFKELEAAFHDSVKEDIKDLKSELGLASQQALWSQDIIYSTVAVAGAFVEPIAALTGLGASVGLLGVIPLMKIRAEYRAARREALKKHFSSWVLVAKPGPAQRMRSRLRY